MLITEVAPLKVMTMNAKPIESVCEYCPRCGAHVGVSVQIPFRCPDCGFADFFGPVAAVGGLITNASNELLLVRRARDPGKGKWGLPGGFVDRGETIEQALAREVLEETGLRVARPAYLTSFPNSYDYAGVVSPVIDLFYLCRVGSGVQIELALDELDHYVWVRPSDTDLDQMAFPSNRRAIEYWLETL